MRIKGFWPHPVSDGPDGTVEGRKAFLRSNPDQTLSDAWFPTQRQAVDAAKRFERGERVDGGWSPDEFFASWVPGKNPEAPEEDGWIVVFGSREGMPHQWAEYWKVFNDRRERRNVSA